MPDNSDEILKKKLVGSVKSQQDGEELDVGLGDVKRMLKEKYEIQTLRSLVEEPARNLMAPPQQPATPVATPEPPFKLTGNFDISKIIEAETTARNAAEMSKDQIQRDFFMTIANGYKEALSSIRTEIGNLKPNAPAALRE